MLARFITMGPVGGNQKVKVKCFLIARGERSSKTRTNRGQENRMLIWVLAKMGQGSLPLRERNKLKNIWHSSIPLATPPENYNKD